VVGQRESAALACTGEDARANIFLAGFIFVLPAAAALFTFSLAGTLLPRSFGIMGLGWDYHQDL
jgi:hypothetical protein